MNARKELIHKLTSAINAREDKGITFKQVSHYVGNDMKGKQLSEWLQNTISGSDPVTSADVLNLWDVEDSANEILALILTEEMKTTDTSLLKFKKAITLNEVEVSGIGIKSYDCLEDVDANDEESTASYNVKIKSLNFEINMKMLLEFNDGWELTRKRFTVEQDGNVILSQDQFDTNNESEWAEFLGWVRDTIHNTVLDNGDNYLFDQAD